MRCAREAPARHRRLRYKYTTVIGRDAHARTAGRESGTSGALAGLSERPQLGSELAGFCRTSHQGKKPEIERSEPEQKCSTMRFRLDKSNALRITACDEQKKSRWVTAAEANRGVVKSKGGSTSGSKSGFWFGLLIPDLNIKPLMHVSPLKSSRWHRRIDRIEAPKYYGNPTPRYQCIYGFLLSSPSYARVTPDILLDRGPGVERMQLFVNQGLEKTPPAFSLPISESDTVAAGPVNIRGVRAQDEEGEGSGLPGKAVCLAISTRWITIPQNGRDPQVLFQERANAPQIRYRAGSHPQWCARKVSARYADDSESDESIKHSIPHLFPINGLNALREKANFGVPGDVSLTFSIGNSISSTETVPERQSFWPPEEVSEMFSFGISIWGSETYRFGHHFHSPETAPETLSFRSSLLSTEDNSIGHNFGCYRNYCFSDS
ncbi:hypothetical protein DFH06DRAFT_1122221 [Mycena polygramma]|nr:hypothetical protein DFH06DRAFT_1122221 [Mycena polygramma]